MATIKGLDVSNYQGDIGTLPADIAFVIIKVTEGTSYVSPYWQQQRDQVRSQGKLPLYYHFLDVVDDAINEAGHFAAVLGNSWQPGEGAAVDWETGSYSSAVDAGVAAYIKECKQLTTVLAMLYSNDGRIEAGPWPQTLATGAGLWDAAWSTDLPPGGPWPFVAIWQNSDNGQVSGVTGDVDTDVAEMDEDHLKLYGFKMPVTPSPVPEPTPVPTPTPAPVVPTPVPSGGTAIDVVVKQTPPTQVSSLPPATPEKTPVPNTPVVAVTTPRRSLRQWLLVFIKDIVRGI